MPSARIVLGSAGLKPHRVRHFKLSTDPKFVEKLRNMVGLYVAPPERAIVFSFGEKSQIQNSGPSPAGAAAQEGAGGHDVARLRAARDHDAVRGARHRHRRSSPLVSGASPAPGVIRFLRTVEKPSDLELDLHFILDNYATHKYARGKGLAGQAEAVPEIVGGSPEGEEISWWLPGT